MRNKTKTLTILTLGWFFIILGVIGLFLPLLQGILFIFIGVYLLSRRQPWASNLLVKLKIKHPKIYSTFEILKTKVKTIVRGQKKNDGSKSTTSL